MRVIGEEDVGPKLWRGLSLPLKTYDRKFSLV